MKLNLKLPFLNKPEENNEDAEKQQELEKIKQFSKGLVTIEDIIAPEAIEVDFTFQKINSSYSRTLFVAGYPRSVPANWLSPLINFPHQLNTSMFIFPMDSGEILDSLKRKITEMEAEIQSDIRSGKISNVTTEIQLVDARNIREQLAAGSERFFQFGLYTTIKADSVEVLEKVTKSVQSTLGSLLIVSKKTTLQMDQGFKTTLPMGVDFLDITRNMDTTSLATTFPFVSSELTSDQGILYGINEHNESLVIFDRFQLENYNMLILAKSGAGKSYAVKVEILRQLMFDTEVIVLDPEREYEELCEAVGGEYINFTFGSEAKINPFDLSQLYEEGSNELGQKILSLHGLLKVMLGEMTAEQEALLDRALVAAYKSKGITPDPATQKNTPPLMEDLYKILAGMENKQADDLVARLEKFITGSFRGILDQPTNIDIKNPLTVFSVKEMEEELRPIAMYIILDFIWTKVKKDFKKRILVIDEAWYFMQHPDSASFIYAMTKRARKYFLGITTITQDVEDFIDNEFGKAIVANASIKLLMKQSTVSIKTLTENFYLSKGERQLLVAADVGQGIFFLGQNHVALRVVASPEEHQLITTDPNELMARKKEREFNAATQAGQSNQQKLNQTQPQIQSQSKPKSSLSQKRTTATQADTSQIQTKTSQQKLDNLYKKTTKQKERKQVAANNHSRNSQTPTNIVGDNKKAKQGQVKHSQLTNPSQTVNEKAEQNNFEAKDISKPETFHQPASIEDYEHPEE